MQWVCQILIHLFCFEIFFFLYIQISLLSFAGQLETQIEMEKLYMEAIGKAERESAVALV